MRIFLAITALSLLTYPVTAQAQSFGDYLIARQAQQGRDWNKASDSWDNFLKTNKDFPQDSIADIRSRASLTALASGDYETAITAAQETLEKNKETLGVFDKMLLATYAVKEDDLALARTVLKDIKEDAFQQLVIPTIENYLKKGDYDNKRLNFAAALRDLSKLFLHEGREDSTLLFARLADYLAPELEGVDLLLADTLYSTDNYPAAYDAYLKVTPDNPDFIKARLLAARSLKAQGKVHEAISFLQETQKQQNSIDIIYELGDYLRAEENHKQAIRYYTDVLKAFDKKDIPKRYAYAYYLRAISYESEKQWDKAETDLMKAIEYFPDDAHILNYLGYGWIDRDKNIDQGIEMIRHALSIQPNDGYITDSLGWALYKKGQYEEAATVLEQAVELVPYDPILNDHLGDAYWQVGRKQEAIYQWERALNNKEEDIAGALNASEVERKISTGL
jgi:tetratricopeptide (TPR) repeat protein